MEEVGENLTNEEDERPDKVVPQTPKEDKEIRVLLIGATGSGKSSTGNTILSVAKGGEKEIFFDPALTSEPKTRDTKEITRTVLGRKLVIVDTPGADNIVDDPVEIQKEIRSAIEASDGYDIIIFVLSPLEHRLELNDIDLKVINVIEMILGEKFWDHGIFLFTHGNNYEKLHETKKRMDGLNYALLDFEEFVKQNRLSRNRYAIGPQANKVNFVSVKFENTEANESIRAEMVDKLLSKIDELVERNEGKLYNKSKLPPEQFFVPSFFFFSKAVQSLKNAMQYLDTPTIIIMVLVAMIAILLVFSISK